MSTIDIVGKILSLPVVDRLWPNCLNRPIRNASPVDVEDFIKKMHKAAGKSIVYVPSSTPHPTASRTRSKQSGAKPTLSTQSISSGSPDTSAPVTTLAVGSGQQFAKGTRQLSLSILCLCLVLCSLIVALLWITPVVLIVEFKTPTIKPLMMSSRDLFAKRIRDDKSTETESSKAAMLHSPTSSPSARK